jgi:hypothetical protein
MSCKATLSKRNSYNLGIYKQKNIPLVIPAQAGIHGLALRLSWYFISMQLPWLRVAVNEEHKNYQKYLLNASFRTFWFTPTKLALACEST